MATIPVGIAEPPTRQAPFVNNPTTSSPTPALELSGVSKSFGSTRALVDVDLDVADGELLALVGPSGCGKSTLLRVVAGLNAADRGAVHIGGVLVEDGTRRADPEHRDVGLVFQEHALFPHLTVSDNLMFGLRNARRDRAPVAARPLAADDRPRGQRQPLSRTSCLAASASGSHWLGRWPRTLG